MVSGMQEGTVLKPLGEQSVKAFDLFTAELDVLFKGRVVDCFLEVGVKDEQFWMCYSSSLFSAPNFLYVFLSAISESEKLNESL